MSSQTTNDFLMYALYCLPLMVILAVYLARQKRVHKHSSRAHHGLRERGAHWSQPRCIRSSTQAAASDAAPA